MVDILGIDSVFVSVVVSIRWLQEFGCRLELGIGWSFVEWYVHVQINVVSRLF
jgi:hypothetical protein